jgi:hypothetical protein
MAGVSDHAPYSSQDYRAQRPRAAPAACGSGGGLLGRLGRPADPRAALAEPRRRGIGGRRGGGARGHRLPPGGRGAATAALARLRVRHAVPAAARRGWHRGPARGGNKRAHGGAA